MTPAMRSWLPLAHFYNKDNLKVQADVRQLEDIF